MLARVLRLPGKALAALFGALLLAHAGFAIAGFHEAWFRPDQWSQNLVWLAASLAVVLVGRLFLSLLPPGPTGAHDLDGLAETWATCLVLGWLVVLVATQPMTCLREAPYWLVCGVPLAVLLVLALARWLTLPGAMVPRHRPVHEPIWPARAALYSVLALWCAYTLFTRAQVAALAWVALAILLERGLALARRAAPGRLLLCTGMAVVGNPSGKVDGGLVASEIVVAAILLAGAAFLIPWLRRADKRAGVLAGLFLSSFGLAGWDPLALVGPLVYVLASHPRQRRFALTVAACTTLACLSLHMVVPLDLPSLQVHPRGRMLLAWELLNGAGEREVWGLAWPLVALALLLGALSFRWRPAPWTPGTIEEPLRETRALAALLVLAAVALALPASPWFEGQVLVILFPLAALLAGLLLLPTESQAERPPGLELPAEGSHERTRALPLDQPA